MLTLREAAEQLGMTPDTLRQAIARGVLKATKIGESDNRALWIVEQEEIDRYRAEHRRKS